MVIHVCITDDQNNFSLPFHTRLREDKLESRETAVMGAEENLRFDDRYLLVDLQWCLINSQLRFFPFIFRASLQGAREEYCCC